MKLQDRRERILHRLLQLYVVVVFCFIFAPMVMVVLFSLNADRFPSFPLKGFTLTWYQQLAGDTKFLYALKNSLLVASGVSFASTVLGFIGAYALQNLHFRLKNAYLALMISPLAIPWIILGIALLIFFHTLGIGNSLFAVWIGHMVFSAPFAMLVIRSRLIGIKRNLEEAAWDLGASRWRALWEVVVPLAGPGLLAAALLTFTFSFDEFIIAWFLSGFEITLPVRIWGLLSTGIDPTINAIGTLVLFVSITLIVVSELLLLSRRPKGKQ